MDRRAKAPFVVPVFIPQQGCRHNCVFCNQTAITGHARRLPEPDILRTEIRNFLSYNNKEKKALLAFYGGNFLGLTAEEIDLLLNVAEEFVEKGKIEGIRFSTRPDTVTDENLERIAKYSVFEIELGVQSMDDAVLALNRRGHQASDTETAAGKLKNANYRIGLQLMIGLPGQTRNSAMATGEKIVSLRPNFVRIYPALVLKNSLLANWWQKGEYRPLSLDEAVLQAKQLYLLFQKASIPVIRMGLQSSDELEKQGTVLAGPHHPAFGHLVHCAVAYDAVAGHLGGCPPGKDRLEIRVSPRYVSRVQGNRNVNVRKLEAQFGLEKVVVVSDPALSGQSCIVDGREVELAS